MKHTGKVIEVIDHYLLRINMGSNAGVLADSIYEVYKNVDRGSHREKIQKGIGRIVELEDNSSILRSAQTKTGGIKAIKKTGSGEAFADEESLQENNFVTVNPEENPLPFSQAEVGDIVKPVDD